MRLLNLNSILYLFFFLILFSSKSSAEEESVDIWKKKEKNKDSVINVIEADNQEKKIEINFKNKETNESNIKIAADVLSTNALSLGLYVYLYIYIYLYVISVVPETRGLK